MLSALVLTAGLGTRLDPLTRLLAKPAVPVAGRTLVERVLDWLSQQGARDVVLNLHFKPETITGVVGDGTQLGLRVRYSWESQLLGSAGGPRRALPLLSGDTAVIVNGDTLCDLDLAQLVAAHQAHDADVTLAVVPNPAPDRYNGIVADSDGRVVKFEPRGRAAHATWHFVGVQVVNLRVFAGLSDGVPAETVAGLYREQLASGSGRIRICQTDAAFVDIGTPGDYLEAVQVFAGERASTLVVEGAGVEVDPSATLRRSVAWPGARVGRGVILDECVIAGGARLPADFRARRAVLLPASYVRDADRVRVVDGVAIFPFPSRRPL